MFQACSVSLHNAKAASRGVVCTAEPAVTALKSCHRQHLCRVGGVGAGKGGRRGPAVAGQAAPQASDAGEGLRRGSPCDAAGGEPRPAAADMCALRHTV